MRDHLRAALIAAFSLLGACDDTSPPPPAAAATAAGANTRLGHGKGITAPIRVEADLAAGSGTVHVTFERAAENVSVELSGVDGLVVTSARNPIREAHVAGGALVSVPVAYTHPALLCHLVVVASGEYRGRKRSIVRSFSVGRARRPARSSHDEQTVTIGGRRLRLMPATRR